MISNEQYEVWILELSDYFVKNHKYQIITLNQESKEVWLVNKTRSKDQIIMVSSKRIEDFDIMAIEGQRKALSLLLKCQSDGINISINPDSQDVSDANVLVGVGHVSSARVLNDFVGLDRVINPTSNIATARTRALSSLNKSMRKLQKMANLKNNKVTTVLSGLMILGFILTVGLMVFYETSDITALMMLGAYTKPMVSLGNEWWRLITPMFLHADLLHLLMNLIAFKNIATIVEPELGWKRYLLVMVMGVFFGTAFTFIQGEHVIAVGASAGIYALLGVMLVMMYERDLFKNRMVLRQVLSILSVNLLLSLMPGVSFIGHLGGFYIGVFFGFAFSKRKDWEFIRNFGSGMLVASIVLVVFLINQTNVGVLPSATELDMVVRWHELGFEKYAEKLFRLLTQ